MEYYEGRISLNFYPKFENSTLQRPGEEVNFLRITEKHSGSLILFGGQKNGIVVCNSKNSSCNDFTRLFMILLKKYFECVWPEDAMKFSELCDYLYANILCLSFELVVKDRLGQHGAAPHAAYFVLTAISAPKEEEEEEGEETTAFIDKRVFLSPVDITEFATRWRLPVNTEWWIPVKTTETVARISDLLEEWRWASTWTKIDSVISEFTRENDGFKLEFLSHGATQGEVLEGLVCQQLSVDESSFAELQLKIQRYNDTMEPFKDDVLRNAVAMNLTLSSDSIAQALQKPCGDVTYLQRDPDDAFTPMNRDIRLCEPLFRKDIGLTKIWSLLVRYNPAFERIRLVYAPYITLRTYAYGPRLSVVIEISNDDVFNFFPMHGLNCDLFRGMVIDFGEDLREPEEFLKSTNVHIHDIVKIKCLAYLIRTFGVRNNLARLFKDGEEAIDGMIRHFLVNWSVPAVQRPAVDTFLRAIYTHLLCLPDDYREEAKKNYLKFFEAFFESGDPATVPIRNLLGFPIIDPASVESSISLTFSNLYVCDFRAGNTITSDEFTETYDFCISSNHIKSAPMGNKVVNGSVIVVFPPAAADSVKKKMYDNMMTTWVASFEKRDPRNKVLVNPSKDELMEAVRNAKQEVPKPSLSQQQITVAIFLGWPLAAGKSTHAEMLKREHGYMIVSSDDCNARNVKFSDAFFNELKKGSTRIVLDKNVPDDNGLRSIVKMIDEAQNRTKLMFTLTSVVPSALQPPEFYEERILQRTGTDHCFRPELVGPEWSLTFRRVFYYPSRSFNAYFQSLPGAVRIDPKDAVAENASKIAESTPVLCSVLRSFESESDNASYIAAFPNNFPGHVTLSHRQNEPLVFAELKQFVGQTLSLTMKSYLLAEQCNEEGSVFEGGHRIGLFVVVLENGSPFIPPSDLYHITDHGTLMFKTKPVMAKSVMAQYRGHEIVAGDIIWKITELDIRETTFSATICVSK